ncbi:lipoprotein [Candidatus Hamiltonella defensa]|uniref:lipoprotein n=1 Tax=Candidatus Williamhamiltonella defendens TaxID=138072 RepID=UPI001F3395F3|nr:lipoprotein [Candidatus Hamiltonella defensa]
MKKTLITVALAIAALSGCSSTRYEPSTYSSNHSRAYNIAEAGGLVTGIQDASVPRDKLERLTDTKTFGTAYVLSGYMSPSWA